MSDDLNEPDDGEETVRDADADSELDADAAAMIMGDDSNESQSLLVKEPDDEETVRNLREYAMELADAEAKQVEAAAADKMEDMSLEDAPKADGGLLSFEGRISRSRYWLVSIITSVGGCIAIMFGPDVLAVADPARVSEIGVYLTLLAVSVFSVLFLWVALAAQAKRWHDLGKSGRMVLILFIPIVGVLWAFVVLGFRRGTVGANPYGSDPILGAKTPDLTSVERPLPVAIGGGVVGIVALVGIVIWCLGGTATPLPDVASVKSTLTPAQLAIGDPIENSIGMVLVPIPAGEFTMGSPESEEHRDDDETQHRVTLTKSFHLSRTEVTQGQWEAVMEIAPWKGAYGVIEGDDYPATFVSWDAAVEFCRKLSEKEGVEYRLPTEVEWEYACRAGTTTEYSSGFCESEMGEYAWYDKNAGQVDEEYAHIVGQKKPNPWGLYDMHGNVAEWCQEYYGKYPSGSVANPRGPSSRSGRVDRGGSWSGIARYCRSAHRDWSPPWYRRSYLGFRVLRSSGESSKKPVTNPSTAAKTPDVSPTVGKPLPVAKPVGDPIENSIGMVLVPIPAGEFYMGSRLSAADVAKRFEVPAQLFEDEHPRHRVTLTKPFHLGATEVTIGQFRQFVLAESYRTEAETDGKGGFGFNTATGKIEQNPKYNWKNSGFAQTDDHPAVNVSWNDAQAFCRWLSAKEGVAYRLPTEAEWEYACRAGSTTIYHNGDDLEGLVSVGNVLDVSAKTKLTEYPDLPYLRVNDGYAFTAPVGGFRANPWGLYDLHGNVIEWCQDWYGEYPADDVTDPVGPGAGSFRMQRGGSWDRSVWFCCSAFRGGDTPSDRGNYLGFRVLRSSAK